MPTILNGMKNNTKSNASVTMVAYSSQCIIVSEFEYAKFISRFMFATYVFGKAISIFD